MFERGTYVLVLELTHHRIMRVGSLGRIRFARGYYAYAGSARRGMRPRIARHLAREKMKRWHIDWLTTQPGVVPIAVASTERTCLECRIAAALASRADLRVKGFGCSDCGCGSHLCYFSNADALSLAVKGLRRYGVSVEPALTRFRQPGRHPRMLVARVATASEVRESRKGCDLKSQGLRRSTEMTTDAG